jgi:hypothetical protein
VRSGIAVAVRPECDPDAGSRANCSSCDSPQSQIRDQHVMKYLTNPRKAGGRKFLASSAYNSARWSGARPFAPRLPECPYFPSTTD